MVTLTKSVSAQDRFRQRVNESATSQRSAELTRGLAKKFRDICENRNQASRVMAYDRFERNLVEQWHDGRFSVIDEIDFAQLASDIYGREDWRKLRAVASGVSEQYRARNVQETLVDVMTSDNFANLLTTTIRMGMIERAQLAPMSLLSMVNTNLRLAPGRSLIPRVRSVADVVDDCNAELEPTQSVGVPTPNLVEVPKACKKKFSIGITRELLAMDINGEIRSLIDAYGESMDLHIEKLLVDMMFGLYDTGTAGANPFPYVEDGVMWHTYLNAAAGGFWTNDITGAAPDGTFQPFEVLAKIIEKVRDPYSGEPLNIRRAPKIVATNGQAQQLLADGLGVVSITQDLAGSGAKRAEITRSNARFGVGPNDIMSSAYIWDRLKKWYMTTAGGALNDTASSTAADNTWLYGDFSKAFGFGTEWDREKIERSGTNTYEYFSQEVVFQVKWLEKSTPIVLDPMYSFRCRS